MKLQIIVFCLCNLLATCNAYAERYAVLVGVSHYAMGKNREHVDLQGPDNDVPSLRSTLLDMGFAPSNITVLLDEEARRDNILAALRAAVTQTKSGDLLVFYFSGHGTSSFDRKNQAFATDIGPNSGALLPYDLDISSPKAALQSILIGRRDLRPILARLDAGARALVILDACYSQDSAKGLELRGDPRTLDLNALLESRQVGAGSSVLDIEMAMLSTPPIEEAYPYRNVVSLAASSKDETAADMSTRFLETSHIRTIDQRPHGAFTNSLLKGLSGAADTDHDGKITVDELFRYAREDMRPVFKQTPQVLEPGDEVNGSLAKSIDLGTRRIDRTRPAEEKPATSLLAAPEGTLAVNAANGSAILLKISDVPPGLRTRLLRLPGIVETQEDYDLLVRRSGDAYEIYNASRTLVARFAETSAEALVQRVGAERDVAELVSARLVHQDFNLDLDLSSPRHVGSVHNGQHLKVVVNSAQPAYLLLFDIDPTGRMTVLYPGKDAEESQVAAGRQIQLMDGVVGPPFGTEYLKLLAFREKPAGYEQWGCKPAPGGRTRCLQFEPGSTEFHQLMELIRQPGSGRSQALLRVVSTE